MDKSTFEARAMACAKRLYGVAYLILRDGGDCEDAVQEALYRVWTKLGSLRDESFFETWLTRILVNESKRLLKRRASRPVELNDGVQVKEAAQPEDAALRDAIRSLDMKYRLPVILYYVEGYKMKEVAGILRLPENTVKSRMSRARELLKEELTDKEARK